MNFVNSVSHGGNISSVLLSDQNINCENLQQHNGGQFSVFFIGSVLYIVET